MTRRRLHCDCFDCEHFLADHALSPDSAGDDEIDWVGDPDADNDEISGFSFNDLSFAPNEDFDDDE